jgi:hypothetical protein
MSKCPERRSFERFPVNNMKATISIRSRFGAHQGDVVDFNRHGITVALRRPIPTNKPLLITLRYAGLRLDAIVGAAHHCRLTGDGAIRCGIRFRTNSPNQLDRDEIELILTSLETRLANAVALTAT